MPQATFWIAIANEKSDRGQLNWAAMGIWNTPKLARMPKFRIRIAQPAIRMGVKMEVLVISVLRVPGTLIAGAATRQSKHCNGGNQSIGQPGPPR